MRPTTLHGEHRQAQQVSPPSSAMWPAPNNCGTAPLITHEREDSNSLYALGFFPSNLPPHWHGSVRYDMASHDSSTATYLNQALGGQHPHGLLNEVHHVGTHQRQTEHHNIDTPSRQGHLQPPTINRISITIPPYYRDLQGAEPPAC